MFSQTQLEFCSEIVVQYDYYVAYYYGSYYDYQVGETRDSKILIYCSDTAPVVLDDVYQFADCVYYEITSNKYVTQQFLSDIEFAPIGSNDIVYTNCIEGAPQFCYSQSALRTYDFVPVFVYLAVACLILILISKLLFGGRN